MGENLIGFRWGPLWEPSLPVGALKEAKGGGKWYPEWQEQRE